MMIEEDNSLNISLYSSNELKTNIEGKGDQGPKGNDGITYIPEINSIETVEPNIPADVSVNVIGNRMIFDFKIPKGKTGDMSKDIYDTDNDGIVDEAKMIGRYTADTLNTNFEEIDTNFSNINKKVDNQYETISNDLQKIGYLDALNTESKDTLVAAINELVNTISESKFTIEEKGDFVYKKYENGFVEIYQCSQITVILSNDYMPSSAKWTPCDFTLPEAIKELYSINTNISDTQENALMGCSYRKPPTTSGYKLYIFDFAQVRTKDVVVYTTITGKWK